MVVMMMMMMMMHKKKKKKKKKKIAMMIGRDDPHSFYGPKRLHPSLWPRES
jgi:hypothetical protein